MAELVKPKGQWYTPIDHSVQDNHVYKELVKDEQDNVISISSPSRGTRCSDICCCEPVNDHEQQSGLERDESWGLGLAGELSDNSTSVSRAIMSKRIVHDFLDRTYGQEHGIDAEDTGNFMVEASSGLSSIESIRIYTSLEQVNCDHSVNDDVGVGNLLNTKELPEDAPIVDKTQLMDNLSLMNLYHGSDEDVTGDNTMVTHDTDDSLQKIMEFNSSELMSMDEKWKIIFSEQARAPLFAVGHYITYLKKHVENEKGHKQKTKKVKDGIHPLSYLLRKLKLDLKMSYESFVGEFIKTPNNGLHLLIKLLRQLQNTSRQKSASVASKESRLEEFKRQLADEHDCLLCIKFTLRCQSAVEMLVGEMDHLQIVSTSLLSNTIKSRVVTLEIMTVSLSVPDGFDRVFETFTYMRLKFGESVRFKLLISMLFTPGYGQIIFQVSAMRFLNTLIAASGSGNLKVYLQQEIEMAGLDIDVLSKFTQGDGLEFDDLRREVEEWKFRYIDVDSLLKKPKPDVWSKEERPRFSDQDSRLTPNTYQDGQVIPPKPYPNASRELPPVPSFTEIPANSLQLLMSLIHQQKQEAKNDVMQALNESRRNSKNDDDDDDMTSDYNTDQELYIAHVYKNTDDCFSDSSKDNTLPNPDQIRRHSEGMVLLRKNRVPDNENIYETLNTVRTKELIDPCGLEVQKRRASVKTLGSLNGNWVLKSHLSMPSLNTIERPTSEIRGDGSGASDGKPKRHPVILTERVGEPDGADRSPRTPPEPEPDYSPDVTPNGTMAKCNSEAIKLLNDFDKMLDQHESKPKTRSSREPDYIPSGTITFV